MPTSHSFQINEIIMFINILKPKRLLDVGVGFGKYGFLAREYLEFWDGREQYNDWQHRIDGIEVFEDYITPAHKFIYDEIFIGNAIDILPTFEKSFYDLILMIDVLEHFEKDDGLKVLKEGIRCGKNVLISIPHIMYEQGAIFGNVYETHRTIYSPKHFVELTKDLFFLKVNRSIIIYIGENHREIFQKISKLISIENIGEPKKEDKNVDRAR